MTLLPLPIAPQVFNEKVLTPALRLLPQQMDSPEARVLVVAIALQESDLAHRAQVVAGDGRGPARGLLQFEKGGAVRGVMSHPATRVHAREVCVQRGVAWDRDVVWAALERDDILAAAFARLNLWWAPGKLPAVDDIDAAWHLYADVTWRPGKPHPEKWPANHQKARDAVGV